ncbi:Acetyl-CoA acetyltransferase (fragment) [Burkholderia cenocepacia]
MSVTRQSACPLHCGENRFPGGRKIYNALDERASDRGIPLACGARGAARDLRDLCSPAGSPGPMKRRSR